MKDINRLKEIFTNSLSLPADTDFDKLKYRDYSWDSLAHMQMISEIENEYDIMFDTEDIIAMSSFNIATELLKKYDVEFE